MSTIPKTHKAAVYTGSSEDGKFIEVKTVDTPSVKDDEVLIKAISWAANPTDWKHITSGWSEKGNISGSDVSGIVVKVGSAVPNFKVGDHVSSYNRGGNKKDPKVGLFQEYVKVLPRTTIKYDAPLQDVADEKSLSGVGKIQSFQAAASINLGLQTVGLPFHHFFKLSFDKSAQTGKSVLIWGGATATGILAIQVAKHLYGLNVIATASSKHHEYLKKIGADATFDYKDSDVVSQIKAYGGEDLIYGLDTVSVEETFNQTYQSLSDKSTAFIDNLLFLNEKSIKGEKKANVKFSHGTLVYLVQGDADLNGSVVPSSPELRKDHDEFLATASKAVNSGLIYNAPVKLLHKGLGSVDEAFSLLRNNKVSGQKVVFSAKDTDCTKL